MNKKRIAIFIITIVILLMTIITATAAPATNPTGSVTGGALSRADTIKLSKAIIAQMAFVKSSYNMVPDVEPLAIIAKEIANDDQWQYSIILAPNSAKIDSIPEDWGAKGTHQSIGVTYYYKATYSFNSAGGMGSWVYVSATNSELILNNNEWIVYLYKGMVTGTNDSGSFPWGHYSLIYSVDNWLNAMSAYEGEITPEKVEEARQQGYQVGMLQGRIIGEEDGIKKSDTYWKAESKRLADIARAEGEQAGYQKAVEELETAQSISYIIDIPSVFTAVPTAAKSIINNAFGFELFGINIAGLLSVLLIVAIVAFIVHKLMKG